jgi:hypothetical protein
MATTIASGLHTLSNNEVYEVPAATEVRIITKQGVLYFRPKGDGSHEPSIQEMDKHLKGKDSSSLECTVDTYLRVALTTQVSVITGIA